jgi:hypothetical protein
MALAGYPPCRPGEPGHPAGFARNPPMVTPSRSACTSGPRLAACASDGLRKKTARGGKGRRSTREGGAEVTLRNAEAAMATWRSDGIATGLCGTSSLVQAARETGACTWFLDGFPGSPGPRTRRPGSRHGASLGGESRTGRTPPATECRRREEGGAGRHPSPPARKGWPKATSKGDKAQGGQAAMHPQKCTVVRTSPRSKASRDRALPIRSSNTFLETGVRERSRIGGGLEVRGGNERGDAPRLRGGGVLRGV